MRSSSIPRPHAFAYSEQPDVDNLPPWAPARFPQTLPMDIADVASSIWIGLDTNTDTCAHAQHCDDECSTSVPWLDRNAPPLDATLLAELDAQLLHRPEQAFADICWAAAVHDVDASTSAPVPSAHPPLADLTNTSSVAFTSLDPFEDDDQFGQDACPPDPYEDGEFHPREDEDVYLPAPPYGADSPRAVDEHNRLLGAPFADTLNFTPLRRHDLPFSKGDPAHDPYPRYKPDLDAAALLMLQPQPLTHWHVSGTVAADSVGSYPIPRTPKAPGRLFAYFHARTRP
ncbi:hypothetical protein GGX14DRAFT_626144 [Mycena pura]|uniref:Uncharacterized protein n=1 Tax=Mycena pura TaxID=153505 RepID=A0AAD6YFJ2_9AGAR|nr:hypothetical protein GGX14DRAFT_626144 [Mycena pura]